MHIIDPNNRTPAVAKKLIFPLSSETRHFGFVPDLSECLAGDLILFRDCRPSRASRTIATTQNQNFDAAHAEWTHVAIFLYDDKITEAVPWWGVHTRSLYDDIPSRALRVRRNRGLGQAARYELALRAQSMVGMRYGWRQLMAAGIASTGNLRNAIGFRDPLRNTAICSQVFHDAYVTVAGRPLTGCDIAGHILPAHLSITPDLEDVAIDWIELVRDVV